MELTFLNVLTIANSLATVALFIVAYKNYQRENPNTIKEKVALEKFNDILERWGFLLYQSGNFNQSYTVLRFANVGKADTQIQNIIDKPICFPLTFPSHIIKDSKGIKYLPPVIYKKYPFLLGLEFNEMENPLEKAIYVMDEYDGLKHNHGYYPKTFPTVREFIVTLRDLKEDVNTLLNK